MTVRVAAAQCEVGTDPAANLARVVALVARAADEGAELVVLPEFANHVSVYGSPERAWEVAVDLDDPADAFVAGVAGAAASHGIWVSVGVTVRRRPAEDDTPARITVAQVLVSPTEGVVAATDKQLLMGAERTHLAEADRPAEVTDTPLGPIGMCSGSDVLINEPVRALALGGARIVCAGLDSFALDEASLHVPVRAAQNGLWVVSANKVGPLLPDEVRDSTATAMGLPAEAFVGAGESQVVAPDGTVVARAPREGEAVVVAEVDPGAVPPPRPDGTVPLELRRPGLYSPVAEDVPVLPPAGAPQVTVAAVQADCGDTAALAAEVRRLAREGVELVVLPELSDQPEAEVSGTGPADAVRGGAGLIAAVQEALAGTSTHVVVSVVEAEHEPASEAGPSHAHVGLVLSAEGVEVHQPGVHRPARHAGWQDVLGDRVKVLAAPFGRLSVLVGDDALVPEAARLAVLGGAEVVAVPFSVQAGGDTELVLAELCAENRVCVVAASRPTPWGGSATYDPPADPVWSRPGRTAHFAGTVNEPACHHAGPDEAILLATLHPGRAAHKAVATDTDLVRGRRPELRRRLG